MDYNGDEGSAFGITSGGSCLDSETHSHEVGHNLGYVVLVAPRVGVGKGGCAGVLLVFSLPEVPHRLDANKGSHRR